MLLEPSPSRYDRFLERHARERPAGDRREELTRLFELQLRLIQAETSCAWFFEDLARIETLQVLQYAARATELGEALLGLDLEPAFVETLAQARSNDPEVGDGRAVWERVKSMKGG